MQKGTCVIALVALPLVLAGCGGYGSSKSSSVDKTATVTLNEQNASGESGTATLTKAGEDKTKVVIDLQGSSSAAQPAHIHAGSCDKLNATPEYALTNVQSGKSETTVSASLKELEDEDYAVNVHKSATDLKTYVACGDIGKGGGSGGGGSGNY